MRILRKNVPHSSPEPEYIPQATSNASHSTTSTISTSTHPKQPPIPPPVFIDVPLPSQKFLEKQLTWGLTIYLFSFLNYTSSSCPFISTEKYVKSGVDVDREYPVRKKIGEGFIFPFLLHSNLLFSLFSILFFLFLFFSLCSSPIIIFFSSLIQLNWLCLCCSAQREESSVESDAPLRHH